MYKCYNWQIANDTFVPLPDSNSNAIWRIGYLDWLEWFKDDYIYFNYFPYSIMGIGDIANETPNPTLYHLHFTWFL